MKTKYLILRSDPLSSNFPHLAGMNPNLADIGHVPLFGAFGTLVAVPVATATTMLRLSASLSWNSTSLT